MPSLQRYATAQQQAYAYLHEKIITGEFAAGMRLNSTEVAQALGCSRIPVREALRQLDAEGFITIWPNRGAVVATLSPSEVEDLFELRAAVEVLALRFALPHYDSGARAELLLLKHRMERAQSDPQLWVKRHDEFHQFISDLGRRDRISRELERIRNAVRPYLLTYFTVYGIAEMPGYEHSALIQALDTKDPEHAEATMRDHVRHVVSGIIDFMTSRSSEHGAKGTLGAPAVNHLEAPRKSLKSAAAS